jgi:hypothetical protein
MPNITERVQWYLSLSQLRDRPHCQLVIIMRSMFELVSKTPNRSPSTVYLILLLLLSYTPSLLSYTPSLLSFAFMYGSPVSCVHCMHLRYRHCKYCHYKYRSSLEVKASMKKSPTRQTKSSYRREAYLIHLGNLFKDCDRSIVGLLSMTMLRDHMYTTIHRELTCLSCVSCLLSPRKAITEWIHRINHLIT